MQEESKYLLSGGDEEWLMCLQVCEGLSLVVGNTWKTAMHKWGKLISPNTVVCFRDLFAASGSLLYYFHTVSIPGVVKWHSSLQVCENNFIYPTEAIC